MKKLMIGNEAVARGCFEAGCTVISSYPGTPSTEITEFAATYPEVYTEWAPNEKVAAEVTVGASRGGARAMCAMKHVGLNVAADPLFTASYTGVNGGMMVVVADDPGMHSSQNEQDSRHYAEAAKLLMLEPSDSAECKEYTRLAFSLSERFDTPVLLRLTTRVAHSQSLVEPSERETYQLKEYTKNPAKYVMMPSNARGRHVAVEKRQADLRDFAETTELNKVEYHNRKIGIITAGICYQYAKEVFGDSASYLKLGMVYPLPENLIRDFALSVETCYVIEELDPFFENHCKNLGIKVIGKDLLPIIGEYSDRLIRKIILNQDTDYMELKEQIPVRPPVMCAGCPHRGTFYVLNQLKLFVEGDIGCYTLGASPPLSALDSCLCMGASVSMAHGVEKANRDLARKSVAVLGDSTFIHSGITGLINTVYNKGTSTVLILDNSITGMTGHQQNPTTGLTLKGEAAPKVNLEKLCEALGANVSIVDPFDIKQMKEVIKREVDAQHASVIIVRRVCALLPNAPESFGGKMKIDREKCKSCGLCMKAGCPAISKNGNNMVINEAVCVGCGFCKGICAFGAMSQGTVSHE